jgi:hypothetical protein
MHRTVGSRSCGIDCGSATAARRCSASQNAASSRKGGLVKISPLGLQQMTRGHAYLLDRLDELRAVEMPE